MVQAPVHIKNVAGH